MVTPLHPWTNLVCIAAILSTAGVSLTCRLDRSIIWSDENPRRQEASRPFAIPRGMSRQASSQMSTLPIGVTRSVQPYGQSGNGLGMQALQSRHQPQRPYMSSQPMPRCRPQVVYPTGIFYSPSGIDQHRSQGQQTTPPFNISMKSCLLIYCLANISSWKLLQHPKP